MANKTASLPIHIEKNIGLTPKTLVWPAGFFLFISAVPLLQTRQPLSITLLQSSGVVMNLSLLGLAAILMMLLKKPATLDINEDGVSVQSRKARYFYAWADISHVVRVQSAIRLELKGQSDQQNRYNLISDRFGIAADDLAAILRDGLERWGAPNGGDAARSGQAFGVGRSITPGADAKEAAMKGFKTVMIVQGVLSLGVFATITFGQVGHYTKTVALRQHGVKTDAAVVRYYTGYCGKHGCNLNVEYAYQANDPQHPDQMYHGYEYLAGAHYQSSPDYQYSIDHHVVPIVYDTTNPSRSSLNFNNWIFNRDPLKTMLTVLGTMAGIFGLMFGLVSVVMYASVRKASKAGLQYRPVA